MRLCITTELKLQRTPDGVIWTTGAMPYPFWRRYLDVFDEVRVIARVQDAKERSESWKRADGPQVGFHPVPYYVGFAEFIRRAGAVRRAARAAVRAEDAVIMRVSSNVATSLDPILRNGRPYGLEVVGDPYESLAPGSGVRHPLRPVFRAWFTRQLQRQCQYATAVAYVTERALQGRYPPGPAAFTTHYSSVELPEDAFADKPKEPLSELANSVRLVTVGSMDALYKGFDLLIRTVALCRRKHLSVDLTIIGDGRHRPEFERLAMNLGVAEHVQFRGALPAGQAVRDELDRADLFVLASKTEGIPRVLIEAMARGLPCIASAVGGVPELLPKEDLFHAADIDALAHKVEEMLEDSARMRHAAARNLMRARDFADCQLDARRRRFFEVLRIETEKWFYKLNAAA